MVGSYFHSNLKWVGLAKKKGGEQHEAASPPFRGRGWWSLVTNSEATRFGKGWPPTRGGRRGKIFRLCKDGVGVCLGVLGDGVDRADGSERDADDAVEGEEGHGDALGASCGEYPVLVDEDDDDGGGGECEGCSEAGVGCV